MKTLGIIAGGGALPRRVVEACRASGRPFRLIALLGQAEPARLAGLPRIALPIGGVQAILDALHAAEAREVVLAGRVLRPSLAELRPDRRAAALIARIGWRGLGEDRLLKAAVALLEEEGFQVIGPEQVIDGLLAPQGVLGRVAPSEASWEDIRRGSAVAKALGRADAGQAVVVQDGAVLGLEAIEGTDALIQRCAALRAPGLGPVLVKLAKPGQERRVDLPTIGPATIDQTASAGFCGIAVEAGAALVLDRDETVRRADATGQFLVGIAGAE